MNTTRGPALDGTTSTRRPRLPSPSLVLATAALFVALTGAATAAGIVAYAKRAGTADNAKHLGGKTAAQIAATVHGPAGPQGPAGAVGPGGPKGDQGAAGPGGPAGPAGPKGDVGAVGAGVKIVGTVATQADLPTTGTTGDAYLVGGNAYVWTGSAWTNAGPVQGPKGDKGDKGDTGPTGPAGPQGIQGVAGTAAVSVHKQAYMLDADGEKVVTGSCDTGQNAVNGGWDSATGTVAGFDSKPTVGDDGWQIDLANFDLNNPASGFVYVICLG